jgi:hypothetical protein
MFDGLFGTEMPFVVRVFVAFLILVGLLIIGSIAFRRYK